MVDSYKRVFTDIWVTTNAYIKRLYESPGKEDKGWGAADSLKLFNLLNIRAKSRCTESFRRFFFLRPGTCPTEKEM